MLALFLLVSVAAAEEENWQCPVLTQRQSFFSDQLEFDSAPHIRVPPPSPMRQQLWWALTTYEQYYSDEHPIPTHVPHFDPNLTMTRELFQEEFRRHAQPVIINFSSLRNSGYTTRTWTLDELLHRFPINNHTEEELIYRANSLYVAPTEVDFAPALHTIARNSELKKTTQGFRNFPRNMFFKDQVLFNKLGIVKTPLVDPKALQLDTIWFGTSSKSSNTPLHHDGSDNFISMITGTKQITLVPPTDWRLLDPECNPVSGLCHATTVTDPTTQQHAYNNIHVMTFQLHAGEMLYLPAGWFHSVKNLGPTIMVNNWTQDGRELVGLIKTMMDDDDAKKLN